MRNTTITYQDKEYYIGCNYKTKWQKSKDAHWMLINLDENTGICTLSPKQRKEKDIYVIKTDTSDLIYIDNENNMRKRDRISRCTTGSYLMSLTNKRLAEKFYGCEVVDSLHNK